MILRMLTSLTSQRTVFPDNTEYTFIYFIVHLTRVMSINIHLTENNSEQECPLVDKAYYVDTIAYKVDNSEQWLIDTD